MYGATINGHAHAKDVEPVKFFGGSVSIESDMAEDQANLLVIGDAKQIHERHFFSPGSIKASVFTLIVSIVGAGMLSLPFALQQSGLLIGIFLFIIGAVASYFSLRIIVVSASYSGRSTYGTIAYALLGSRASVFIQIVLLLNMWGTIIGYLVASSSMIHDAIRISAARSHDNGNGNNGDDNQPDFVRGLSNTWIMISMTVLLVVPLSLFRTLGALRYSSVIAVCCTLYLIGFLITTYLQFCVDEVTVYSPTNSANPHQVECVWKESSKTNQNIYAASSFKGILTTVSIVIFAFTCHPNVLPVYLELQRPTETRMVDKVIFRALLGALLLYLVVSVFAYLIFLDQLEDSNGNFLLNDFQNGIGVILGDIFMSIYIVLAIPIMVNACRTSIIELALYATSENMSPEGIEGDESQEAALSTFSHAGLTISIIIVSLIPALLVSDISIIFSLM